MGRKKIQIKAISNEKTRLVTFAKRKNGLFKKAYELSVLCDCEIAIIVFTRSNRLHQYASLTIEHALRRRDSHSRAHEFYSNLDMERLLTRRQNGGIKEEAQIEPGMHDGTEIGTEEPFEGSVTSEELSSEKEAVVAARDSGGGQLPSNTVQSSNLFQSQMPIYANHMRFSDSASGPNQVCMFKQQEINKTDDIKKTLILLDNSTTSSEVATTSEYISTQYQQHPTSFHSSVTVNTNDIIQSEDTQEERDVLKTRRLSLEKHEPPPTRCTEFSTRAPLTMFTTSQPTNGTFTTSSTTAGDEHSSLSSLLLAERRDDQRMLTGTLVDTARSLRLTEVERCVDCGPQHFTTLAEEPTDPQMHQSLTGQSTVSVSVDTRDIKSEESQSHLGLFRQQLYAFGVPLAQGVCLQQQPPHQQPPPPSQEQLNGSATMNPSTGLSMLNTTCSSLDGAISHQFGGVASTNTFPNDSGGGGGTVTTSDTSAQNNTSGNDGIPHFGGKPLSRGLSSLRAGRHKKLPFLSQIKMPTIDPSSCSLSSSSSSLLQNGNTSSVSGRLPQGTFLPTPEVESELKKLDAQRVLAAQSLNPSSTTLDVLRNSDTHGNSLYPLDLRLTPPVPTSQTVPPDPFTAMRNVAIGGHLTSVPLPSTPTTQNSPAPYPSASGADPFLANPLASTMPSLDANQCYAFRAMKRSKHV